MGSYRVVTGQNIYDVALHLYGSVEGIVDLLVNNPALSLETELCSGQNPEAVQCGCAVPKGQLLHVQWTE